MKIVGLDPSLTNTGLVRLEYAAPANSIKNPSAVLTSDPSHWSLTKLCLHETQATPAPKNKKDVKVRKNYDDLARARELLGVLLAFVADADYIAIEIPQIGGQDMQARSMWTSGISLGLVAVLPAEKIIPLTPLEVKQVTGNPKASKEEMCAWAYTMFPDAAWPSRTIKGISEKLKKNHHLADATAACWAGVSTLARLGASAHVAKPFPTFLEPTPT